MTSFSARGRGLGSRGSSSNPVLPLMSSCSDNYSHFKDLIMTFRQFLKQYCITCSLPPPSELNTGVSADEYSVDEMQGCWFVHNVFP